ncbi:hypothetical protein AXF42_Ash001575 [Apostasia shenzhenica]|uniref:Uncharacterized protein n=1 Tax=Apostasia shenzhenica TaxID=1088818 RepID=A0A2I0AAM6_9ASPA|nr:hypothetical protein AXF42_Ash001575 [Apostasia shenzhenica]
MEEEFEEEEVWALRRERKDDSPKTRKPQGASSSSSSRRLSSTPRKIPRSDSSGEEGSSSNLQQSASINIPDWSKVYRQTNLRNAAGAEEGNDAGDEDEGDDEEEKFPPHEWIAKKLARSQISSSSVCEGAGRTLKGRDQRKVRNAVLTRTGFLE